MKNKGCSLSDL